MGRSVLPSFGRCRDRSGKRDGGSGGKPGTTTAGGSDDGQGGTSSANGGGGTGGFDAEIFESSVSDAIKCAPATKGEMSALYASRHELRLAQRVRRRDADDRVREGGPVQKATKVKEVRVYGDVQLPKYTAWIWGALERLLLEAGLRGPEFHAIYFSLATSRAAAVERTTPEEFWFRWADCVVAEDALRSNDSQRIVGAIIDAIGVGLERLVRVDHLDRKLVEECVSRLRVEAATAPFQTE